jgi:hypothetical protein
MELALAGDAGPGRPGVAFADLRQAVPRWLLDTVGALDADVVLVTPHLDRCHTRCAGPRESAEVLARFRRARADLGGEVGTRDGRAVIEWPSLPTASDLRR